MCNKLRVIITSEGWNALYEDGVLAHEAEDDYLNTETLHTLYPEAFYYGIPWQLEEEMVMVNDGYPELLSDFDLARCKLYWPLP